MDFKTFVERWDFALWIVGGLLVGAALGVVAEMWVALS